MEIRINDNVLDTTLENEKFLGEVIDGIKKWLTEARLNIKEIIQDGETLSLDKTALWWNRNINEINNIDIIALTNIEKYIEDLQIVYQYITMLEKALHSGNMALAVDLVKDHKIIGDTLDYFFSKRSSAPAYSKEFSKLIEYSRIGKGVEPADTRDLEAFLTKISFLLKKRIGEISNPVSELKAASLSLSQLIPDIENVSILFQAGKDKQAIDTVIIFIELSEKIIRLYSILKETQKVNLNDLTVESIHFNIFFEEFNDILKELAKAFELSDTVLIGDLLEYEIVPRIDTLFKFIALIEIEKE